ncbi:MAG: hypothetical protein PHV34_23335 [Verrucomicrobiae bacterium]|nr:hypothetical protein [Verrucomicrobiae bacterium]
MKTSFFSVVPSEGRSELAANPKFFMELELVDKMECMEELLFQGVITRQFHDILPVRSNKSGWQIEEIGSDRVDRDCMIFAGKADSFEPMNNIRGEKQQLKVSHVGGPTFGGDFTQRIIIDEFPVIFLGGCPSIVEEIGTPRAGFQIGHKYVISVFSILEEGQLLGFLGVFRNGPPNHNKAMCLFPFLGLIAELAKLPPTAHDMELGLHHDFSHGTMFLGHDDITAAPLVEEFDHVSAVETGIHAKPNATAPHLLRRFGQAHLQEGNNPGGTACIAGPQSSVPEFLQVGLETEQGMIRTSPRFFGVVSDGCFLGLSVNNNDHRVDIESQAVPFLWSGEQITSQTVVEPNQLSNLVGCQTFEKTTERRLIRKTFQPQHFQESTIVLQNFGFVDSSQSHDNCINQSQDKLRGMVASTLEIDADVLLEQFFQSQLAAKTLN